MQNQLNTFKRGQKEQKQPCSSQSCSKLLDLGLGRRVRECWVSAGSFMLPPGAPLSCCMSLHGPGQL